MVKGSILNDLCHLVYALATFISVVLLALFWLLLGAYRYICCLNTYLEHKFDGLQTFNIPP